MIRITKNNTEHNTALYKLYVTEDNNVVYTTDIEIGAVQEDALQDKLAQVALTKQMLNDKSFCDGMRELAFSIPVYNE